MDVITTHTSADFDAIASMVAAGKLYPFAKKVFSGSIEAQVKKFLQDFPLTILRSRNVKLKDITRLIVVDTRQEGRIGKFSQIKNIPIHIYDHHPNQPDDISGDRIIVKEYGATITILLELLRKRGIKITPSEASLFCL
ncbi:MAG: DHH family phosphoesterase, partial [bacterium]